MIKRTKYRSASAFTMMEIIIAMAISTMLMLALVSVVKISTRTLSIHNDSTAMTTDSFELASRVAGDLRNALRFTEKNPTSVTFTVSDRDGDGRPEEIQYEWLSSPTNQLWKKVDLSGDGVVADSVLIADDVVIFNLEYLTRTWGPPLDSTFETNELVLLYSNGDEPEGDGKNLLMVTSQLASLNSYEAARKSLFEAWGFTVTELDQNQLAAIFQTTISTNDLVYVSSEIDAAVLGNKLVNAPIGVVNENPDVAQSLGIGIPSPTPGSRTTGLMTTIAHFIAQEQSLGGIHLFSSNQITTSLDWANENVAADLLPIVRWFDGVALSVLEKGAESFVASPTAGTFGNTIGYSQPSDSGDFDKHQVATKVVLNDVADLESIAAYLRIEENSEIRLGIYSDEYGEPGNLIVETDQAALTKNTSPTWYTIPLPQEFRLSPGTYWIAIGMESDVVFFEQGLTIVASSRWADPDLNPAMGLVAQWTGTYQSNAAPISIYANYVVVPISSGRRVQLPWSEASFDITTLSDKAQQLWQNCLEWAGDTSIDDEAEFEVDSGSEFSQCIEPASSPTNVTGWSVGRTVIKLRRNPENLSGSIQFGLYLADGNDLPTGAPLTQSSLIPMDTFESDEWIWYEIPFLRTDWIGAGSKVCVVVSGTSSNLTDVSIAVEPATTLSEIYVFGTFQTTGVPQW